MVTVPRLSLGESRIVTMRELSQRTAQVINEINESGRPAMLTRHGRFLAVIYPLAHQRIESFVLSRLDELVGTRGFDAATAEEEGLTTEEARAQLGLPSESTE